MSMADIPTSFCTTRHFGYESCTKMEQNWIPVAISRGGDGNAGSIKSDVVTSWEILKIEVCRRSN